MNEYGEKLGAEVTRLLGEARRERGLTMEDLADRADVDRTYIGLVERGERRPTIAATANIVAALDLTLSDVVSLAESRLAAPAMSALTTAAPAVELVESPTRRSVPRDYLLPAPKFEAETGLSGEQIAVAIDSAYHTLDLIDEQLMGKGSAPLAELVELANLSSILGNLLAAGVAMAANGTYERNGPHKYPDLLADDSSVRHDLEVKTALESNTPKGHLPKAGHYLTFRYVLCSREGVYTRGKASRGSLVSVWEAKYGYLAIEDFNVSNTDGDSGKTAVISGNSFKKLETIYFHPEHCPAPQLGKAMKLLAAARPQ